MNKKVVYFEIGCSDIDKTSEFYKAVFNWKLTKHGNAAVINTEQKEDLRAHKNL